MIYINTKIKISDNSGGLILFCIKIYGKKKISSSAKLGDILIGSLKSVSLKKKKLKQGSLVKAVVIRIFKGCSIIDGTSLKYMDSAVVLLNAKNLPFANRVFGAVPKTLIKRGFSKILSIAYATI